MFSKNNVKVKSKTTSSSSKTTTKRATTKVREKKVYSLPGQKHDPPEEVLDPSSSVPAIYNSICIYVDSLLLILVVFHVLVDRKNPCGYSMSPCQNRYHQVKWRNFGEFQILSFN